MTSKASIVLNIDNAIPCAGENESSWIVSLWEGANEFLKNIPFKTDDPYRSAVAAYEVSLHLDAVVALMKNAQRSHGSFANYLQAVQEHADLSTVALIRLELDTGGACLELYSLYNSVGTLIQQLVLAMNIALPGSCQLSGTCYTSSESHRFEAPNFSANLFTNAWLSAFDANWPQLKPIQFRQVWKWLEDRGASETDIAVGNTNKILFGLLDMAQQHHVGSLRDAILVAHMIENLMNVNDGNVALIRERVIATLGVPGDRADSFNELYRLKDSLIRGDYPVRRPALIVHETDDPVLQQLEMHNSPVEQGAAIVLAMIQDLVVNNAAKYSFSQHVSRV